MAKTVNKATLEEMITCERLMMWAHISMAPREELNIYYRCILNELAEKFTSHDSYCESIDQRHVFHKRVAKFGALKGLLPSLFWAETIRHVWGRVILQHLGITLNVNGRNLKPSSVPVFMLPLNCVCCGQKLSNINSDNYSTQPKWKCSQDDSSTYRDCEKTWARMKATFEEAINAMITLGTLPLNQQESFLEQSLPTILSAYHLLTKHLQEYDLNIRPYRPRYSLIPEYATIDYGWFVPYLIYDGTTVTEDNHQPFFRRDLIGKTILAVEDERGAPYFEQGIGYEDKNLITITQLKDFLIKKPLPAFTTTI